MIPFCSICGDTGWTSQEKDGHNFAFFCTCAKGYAMKLSHRREIEEAKGAERNRVEPPIEFPPAEDEIEEEVQ